MELHLERLILPMPDKDKDGKPKAFEKKERKLEIKDMRPISVA